MNNSELVANVVKICNLVDKIQDTRRAIAKAPTPYGKRKLKRSISAMQAHLTYKLNK